MFQRLAEVVLARRLAWGVGLACVALFFIAGIRHLQIDFSARSFFGGEGESVRILDDYNAFWGKDDNGLVVVMGGQGETVLTRSRLEQMKGMEQVLKDDPAVDRVVGLTTIPRFKRDFLGQARPVPLLSTVPGDSAGDAAWEKWRQAILEDPLLVPSLLAEDGKHAAMVLVLNVDVDDIALIRPVVTRLASLVMEQESAGDLDLEVGGIPMVRGEVAKMIVDEQARLVPIAMAIIVVLLTILFRSVHGTLLPLVAAVLPCLMLFGVMGLVGEPVSLVNQAFSTLIPVIAVADAIHMVSRFREELWRSTPEGEVPTVEVRDAAVAKAMQQVGAACFMTTLTTMVGFLSLRMAEMPVLRGFGTFAAVGIALAYGTVLLCLPILLSLTKPVARHPGSAVGLLGPVLSRCADLALGRPWLCLITTGAICVGAALYGGRVEVDNWLTQTLPPEASTSVANRMLDEELGGVISLRYDMHGEEGTFARPEVLATLDQLEKLARQWEGVRAVTSPASMFAYGSEVLGGPREVPQTDALVRHIAKRLEGREAKDALVSEKWDRAQLVIHTQDVGAKLFGEMAEEMNRQVVPTLAAQGITALPTGTPLVAYAGINRISLDLRDSIMMAFGIISVLFIFLVRSVRLGLICVLPNALPLLVGYGLLGVMGWDLEPATGIVFTVALGIAVDDTIHLVARYLEELKKGREQMEALRESILHSGRAVLVTTILLASGFYVNTVSAFPTNVSFGGMGGTVIIAALFCDLFVLPPLLLLFHRPEVVTSQSVAAHS
jgi:predicted RND superfamily exporter protein